MGLMRYIRYSGEVLLTGDAIADAVERLTETVSRYQSAARVRIPVQLLDGITSEVTLIVNAASQVVTRPGPHDVGELIDPDAVMAIEKRIEHLEPSGSAARLLIVPSDVGHWYDDL